MITEIYQSFCNILYCNTCGFLKLSCIQNEVTREQQSLFCFYRVREIYRLNDRIVNIEWESKKLTLAAIISIEKKGYQAIPYHHSKLEQTIQLDWKAQRQRFVVAVCGTIPVMLISISLGLELFGSVHPSLEIGLQYSAMLLTIPVLFYSGYPFIQSACKHLKKMSIGMDFQIAFSSLLMFFYSLYSLLFGAKIAYFEAVAMFITFILCSQLIREKIFKKNE